MKTLKYLTYIIMLSLVLGFTLTSCNDDDAEQAPRLFRPVTTLTNQNNSIVASWYDIKGATSYDLVLMMATGAKDENGEDVYATYREVSVEKANYTFEDVDWDEKYKLYIQAFGVNIESGIYETDDLSIVYPTTINTNPTVIDNAVLVEWNVGKEAITVLKIFQFGVVSDTITVSVSEAEYNSGKIEVWGLDSQTSYMLRAYSGEEQTGDTYQGRITFKTAKPENYDEMFGAGNWLDLRGNGDADALTSGITAGYDAIILEGGFEYKVNNTLVLSESKTYTTGLSLTGNAIFVQSGAMLSSGTVETVTFEKINFISTDAQSTPVREQTAKTFGSKQVYNVNNSGSSVNALIFKDCRFDGYRGVVRMQNASDVVRNVTFDGCTINGVGDQGVVTTTNTAATLENVTFKNSTIMNIVMLCDLRASASSINLLITDCTFCYAPIETTANANTPLLRLGASNVNTSVSNTIFGPSMASDGSGGNTIITYTAGTAGSIFLSPVGTSVGVTNSHRTNFTWTEIGSGLVTYPIDGLNNIGISEKDLFQSPDQENFTIVSSFAGAKTSGAEKWRMP